MCSTHFKNMYHYVTFTSFLCNMLYFLGKASAFDFFFLRELPMQQERIFAIVAEYIKLYMSIQVHVQVKIMFVHTRICTCSTK